MIAARIGVANAVALLAAGIALALRVPGLDMPIIEWHAWRQTWTAYTGLVFHEQGIDLLHPKVPIFGPPFEVPVEFPAVQAAGALLMNTGVAPDLAMRLVHLSLFFLSAALLYGLLRKLSGAVVAVAALVYFLFAPVNILVSRASLVEFGAIAGALAYLWAGIVWRERHSFWALAIAVVAGSLGMLIKPSTPVFWVLPLVVWGFPDRGRGAWRWIPTRIDAGLVLLAVAPISVGLLWTAWADAIKAGQEAAAFHTSAGMRSFYFSSLAERLDTAIWQRNVTWLALLVVGVGLVPLVPLGLWRAIRSTRRAFWAALVLAAILPIAIFYGGYWRHDYYWTAITPEIAAIIGLGVESLVAVATTRRARVLIGLALGVALTTSLVASNDYWRLIYPPVGDLPQLLPRAQELAANTSVDDTVIIIGRAFNSDLAYYARRRALMLTDQNWTDHLVDSLPAKGYHVLFSWTPATDPIQIVTRWAWSGVIAPHTYTLASTPSELRSSPIVATDDTSAFSEVALAGRRLIEAPIRLVCDGKPHSMDAGAQGTWLRLRPNADARVSVASELGPMIARTVLVLSPKLSSSDLKVDVACAGTSEIVIEAAFDAPPADVR